ncbi:probable cation-transporting ATPase 13A3 [Diaphorina citri]|uniref:Probable cation-transporting ATPase 13A3 n=1 Tax=Diaphorina citri TaxID=121845 RepID=A0A3Q0J5L6_DIACI|nr:probable cation-transporting ATPase 13A3 [Diaphorina citri]
MLFIYENQRNLRSTVHSSDVASIIRNGNVSSVSTELLVPGDILVIPPHGCVMHCDAVLLAGNCIVNESMLTGSLPADTQVLLCAGHQDIDSSVHHMGEKRHNAFPLQEAYQQTHKCYYVRDIKTLTAQSIINQNEDNNNGCEGVKEEIEKDPEGAKLAVHSSAGEFKEMDQVRVFDCKKLRYVWDPELRHFYKLCGLGLHISTAQLHDARGLTSVQQYLRRVVYGKNEIAVPMKSIFSLLFLEVLNPFYVFQLFSFALWFADDYTSYAMAIAAMSVFSITGAIIQTRKDNSEIRPNIISVPIKGSKMKGLL